MMYASVLGAVVAALSTEAMGGTSSQAWQKLYVPGVEDGLDPSMMFGAAKSGAISRTDLDCWLYARLHRELSPRHWNVLTARFGGNRGRRLNAIGALIPLITTKATQLFVTGVVTTWAVPKLKGKDGKRDPSALVIPAEYYDMNRWETNAVPERTRWRWKRSIVDQLETLESEALQEVSTILDWEGVNTRDVA